MARDHLDGRSWSACQMPKGFGLPKGQS